MGCSVTVTGTLILRVGMSTLVLGVGVRNALIEFA